LFTEIVITRHVTLQGDPVMMPLIDCQLSDRCFRVKVRKQWDGDGVLLEGWGWIGLEDTGSECGGIIW
jgi:hypothetical protein